MPSLGADMESAKLVLWRVSPGDEVHRGNILAEVETEKGVIEVECFQDGIVERLLVEPGPTALPVGTAMAVIRADGAETAAAPEAPRPAEPVRASPLARRRGKELGVDLGTLRGTGPGGAIAVADVEAAAGHRTEPDAMRHAIAAAMARSNREIPHYYLATSIDMSRTLHWLSEANRERGVEARLLPAAILYTAVARAFKDAPELNASWADEKHVVHPDVHLGIAISLRTGGLVIPAIHHADRKNVDEMMGALRDLISRARAGRLRSSELTDATVTVTNLGDLGVRTVYGVIYPPQVALVGLGKITDQAWVENGNVVARPAIEATLAADHRATDGRRGAAFLEALDRRLQEPEKLA